MNRFHTLFARRGRWGIGFLLAGLVVVPLAVAGLFAGAFGSAGQRVDTIPAIVVNNDHVVTSTGADGTKQSILAGRQLVTELTGPDNPGFHWTISNSADAAAALSAGSAYAVLTIPADFSASVTSLAGTSPRQANLRIRTDDAHSYLAGAAAQSVGQAMTTAFGREITKQYLAGFYAQLGTMGTSLDSAAQGATRVATGAGSLAKGLDSLATGATTAASGAADAASGAASLSSGVSGYTDGVDSLSAGLAADASGADGASQLGGHITDYADGVGQASAGFDDLRAAILADPANSRFAAPLQKFQGQLDALAQQGGELGGQTTSSLGALTDGIAQSAAGAEQLSQQSGDLRSGAADLAGGVSSLSDGVSKLAAGATTSAAGAHTLSDGAGALATGLGSGAKQASAVSDQDPAVTAKVVAEPVTVSTSRANRVDSIGPVIGMLAVPISLWLGALAIFILLRPVTALALASTAPDGRLLLRGLGRAFAIAAAQAIVVVVLLHTTLGVAWTLLPATLSFALLIALIFVAVHQALLIGFGRAGIVVSLVLLALQLTSAGGLYPIELVSGPFRAVSPFLPLTWGVRGFQAIVAGGSGGDVAQSAVVLVVFGLVAAVASWGVIRARRRGPSFEVAMNRA